MNQAQLREAPVFERIVVVARRGVDQSFVVEGS